MHCRRLGCRAHAGDLGDSRLPGVVPAEVVLEDVRRQVAAGGITQFLADREERGDNAAPGEDVQHEGGDVRFGSVVAGTPWELL